MSYPPTQQPGFPGSEYPPQQGMQPMPQPGFAQPGYPQPAAQPGYQPGYAQPGYPPQGAYVPPSFSQGGQPVYPQPGGYGQPQGFPMPGQPHYIPPGQPQYIPPGQHPITTQPGHPAPPPASAGAAAPGSDGWMNMPQGVQACPPGLEYLTLIDQLLVHQKVEVLEALTGFETKNKFQIKNSMGQKVYYAVEESDCLTRNCCGPIRPFDMKILDIYKNQVIHLNRPLACDSCCFPCCLQTMEVSAPPGNVIGTVEQEWSLVTPQFSIKNAQGNVVLKIEGPFCTTSFCGSDVEFKVLSKDGQHEVGKIRKQWAGLLREAFLDADNFGITFPMDLDVRMKAVMLGACFLIDAMYFEKTNNN